MNKEIIINKLTDAECILENMEASKIKEFKEGVITLYDYIIAENNHDTLTECNIKKLYALLTQVSEDSVKYRSEEIYINHFNYRAPSAQDLPHLMEHFIKQTELSEKMFSNLEFAVMCHKRIIDIQPFDVGNGTIARAVLNILMLQKENRLFLVDGRQKELYNSVIMGAQKPGFPDIDRLFDFMRSCSVYQL